MAYSPKRRTNVTDMMMARKGEVNRSRKMGSASMAIALAVVGVTPPATGHDDGPQAEMSTLTDRASTKPPLCVADRGGTRGRVPRRRVTRHK